MILLNLVQNNTLVFYQVYSSTVVDTWYLGTRKKIPKRLVLVEKHTSTTTSTVFGTVSWENSAEPTDEDTIQKIDTS